MGFKMIEIGLGVKEEEVFNVDWLYQLCVYC